MWDALHWSSRDGTTEPEYQNSYRGELGGHLGVMCAIQIIDSIIGTTPLAVDSCENIGVLRQALIHPESVTSQWKQADLISHLIYHSIDSIMLLVHVFGHQNSGKLASTLTPLASLNVRLDALAEYIMASFLRLMIPKNHNIGRILRSLRSTKCIHLRSPSPIQYLPV